MQKNGLKEIMYHWVTKTKLLLKINYSLEKNNGLFTSRNQLLHSITVTASFNPSSRLSFMKYLPRTCTCEKTNGALGYVNGTQCLMCLQLESRPFNLE